MMNHTIEYYIDHSRLGGKTEAEIREDLLLMGWGEPEIDRAMAAAKKPDTDDSVKANQEDQAPAT